MRKALVFILAVCAATTATLPLDEIEAGGHRWPPETVSDARSQAENGVSSQNLNASEVICAFFEDHGRR